MRKEDLEALERPFDGREDPYGDQFSLAIGVKAEVCWTLRAEIFADLDESRFGIGWWPETLEMPFRALIADQLFVSCRDIAKNLVEAKLHLLELTDLREREDSKYLDFARRGHRVGGPGPRLKASDDLQGHLIGLHKAGFFRALGSALDCYAATIVGVLGIPMPILNATYTKLVSRHKEMLDAKKPTIEQEAQVSILRRLIDVQDSVGPTDWLVWVLDMRNMLVHRGRRLEYIQTNVERGRVLTPQGLHVTSASLTAMLPRNPALSDVADSASSRTLMGLILNEAEMTTMPGAFASCVALLDLGCAELLAVWRRRKEMPSWLPQPRSQWAVSWHEPRRGFVGYKANTNPPEVAALRTSRAHGHRFLAAALFDEQRGHWPVLPGV